MSDVTQQIKEKLDIVEFIKSYIQLLPAGKNSKACCPFHKEKTPSFMVSPDRQSWYCFGGCNEGGDIIAFLMKYENLEFYEALQILAEKAGVDLKKGPGHASEQRQYQVLYEINTAAKNFFKKNLKADVLKYCNDRGLQQETIEEFELGFAVSASDQLLRHLLGLGFSAQEVERAGLSFRTERGTYWDRFRGRLIFPIHNSLGKIVGFTGRILPNAARPELVEGQAKYVNSPETPIFNKSKILYGLHKAKESIRDLKLAILVEGQMDFLMSYQSGIKNVVATSGTALTNDHLKLLSRLTDRLILSFDSDEAGQKAAERSIDMALANDLAVRILILPEKDPAEVARQGPDAFKKLLTQSKTARDFYFDRYLKSGQDARQQKLNIRLVLAKVGNLSSNVDRAVWIKELSSKTGIDERTLLLEIDQLPRTVSREIKPKIGSPPKAEVGRKQLIAYRIMDLQNLASDDLKVLAKQALAECVPDIVNLADSSSALRASLDNSNLVGDDTDIELRELVRQLRIEFYKEKISLVKSTIAQVERGQSQAVLSATLIEFDNLIRQLHNFMDEKEGGGESKKNQEKGV